MTRERTTWACEIGEVDRAKLSHDADLPMRRAVAVAYRKLTGEEPDFIVSGWGLAERKEREQ